MSGDNTLSTYRVLAGELPPVVIAVYTIDNKSSIFYEWLIVTYIIFRMKYNDTSFVIFLDKKEEKTHIHLIHDNYLNNEV